MKSKIPRDSFPWMSHRSMAEVAMTERIRARLAAGQRPHVDDIRLLASLEARAVAPSIGAPPDRP